ncbi:MFS transporter [Escherichia coli]
MVCDLYLAANYRQTIGLEDALTASLMLNALLIVGALLGLVLTHLLAHRKFLLGSFLLLAATLVVMACLPSGSSLTLLLLFSSAPPFRQSVIWWAFCLPESFPTDIRSLGVGFATAMSRLGAAVSLACCRGCWRSGECKSPYCSWRQCCWLVLL